MVLYKGENLLWLADGSSLQIGSANLVCFFLLLCNSRFFCQDHIILVVKLLFCFVFICCKKKRAREEQLEQASPGGRGWRPLAGGAGTPGGRGWRPRREGLETVQARMEGRSRLKDGAEFAVLGWDCDDKHRGSRDLEDA